VVGKRTTAVLRGKGRVESGKGPFCICGDVPTDATEGHMGVELNLYISVQHSDCN
jgi:hypothetical protein